MLKEIQKRKIPAVIKEFDTKTGGFLQKTFSNFSIVPIVMGQPSFELLEKLRQSGDETPCIFITSREDKASLKEGFEKGGDDYIYKPVDLDELSLRIHAVLRRQVRSQLVEIDMYQFDILTKTLYLNEKTLELSIKGGELLLVLLEGQGRVVPLNQIKERLWSSSEEASDGALRVYIAQLKKYFPTQIQNIRGVGYQMSTK